MVHVWRQTQCVFCAAITLVESVVRSVRMVTSEMLSQGDLLSMLHADLANVTITVPCVIKILGFTVAVQITHIHLHVTRQTIQSALRGSVPCVRRTLPAHLLTDINVTDR